MGLAGRALDIQLTPFAISQGLVLPDVAVALLGKAGGFACLVLVFMAVTSASSAELIAVSSVLTYDIYRTYIRPEAKGKEVVRFSHICVIGFGILMGVLAVLLNLTGINLGYLYTLVSFYTHSQSTSTMKLIVHSIDGRLDFLRCRPIDIDFALEQAIQVGCHCVPHFRLLRCSEHLVGCYQEHVRYNYYWNHLPEHAHDVW